MGRLAIGLWILAFSAGPELSAGSDDLDLQTRRLEETLGRQRQLQDKQAKLMQLLTEERTKRFGKKDEVADALATLPVKAFPNPVTARDKAGEMAIQTSLVKFATERFDDLSTIPDAEAGAEEKPKKLEKDDQAPKVTSFPVLKQVLDQIGDQVLSAPEALSKVADLAKARAEAKLKAEQKKPETDTASADHPELEETADKKPELSLNQRIAEEFNKSAKAVNEYFKFANDQIKPLVGEEADEEKKKQLAADDPLTPPGADGPMGGEPPGGGGGAGQDPNQGQGNKGQNQAKNQGDKNGSGGGGGGGGGGGEGGEFKPPPAIPAAQIPQPGGVPRVVMSDQPKEPDLSALSEVTQSLAAKPQTQSFTAPGGQTFQPTLGPKAQTAPPTAVPEEPVRAPASLGGERSAGSPSQGGATASSDAGTSPAGPKDGVNGAVSSAGSPPFDAGVFNIGPKYPGKGDSRSFRVPVAFASGGDEDDSGPSGTVSTGAQPQLAQVGIAPLSLPPKTESDRRGILSHVGTLCRQVGAARIAACSK